MVNANGVDPEQTPRFAASDLGLHYLSFTPFWVSRLKQVNGKSLIRLQGCKDIFVLLLCVHGFNPSSAEPGYVLPLQTESIQIIRLLKKPTDLDLNCCH